MKLLISLNCFKIAFQYHPLMEAEDRVCHAGSPELHETEAEHLPGFLIRLLCSCRCNWSHVAQYCRRNLAP